MGALANVTYLINVDASGNHNKFYRMIPCGNRFTVEYGRVGSTGIKKSYPINLWSDKYQEKLRKGYVDQTHLHTDTVTELCDDNYKIIDNFEVRGFIARLRTWANEKIKSSYTVSTKAVTEKMVREAQNIIDSMACLNTQDIRAFNEYLIELYQVLPRRIKDVSKELAKKSSDIPQILLKEQGLLEVMKAQIKTDAVVESMKKSGSANTITVLEAMGLEVRPCTDEEIDTIKEHLTEESAGHFKAAYRVVNKAREKAFNEYVKNNNISNVRMYYHGSRNENIWGILTQGLSLNPKAIITGKMFGYGLYFAPRAKKSINYTSLRGSYWANGSSDVGILAVFKVAVGESLHVNEWNSGYSVYREADIKRFGKNSLYAHAGKSLVNDEIIVYNDAAVTLRYLIELQ